MTTDVMPPVNASDAPRRSRRTLIVVVLAVLAAGLGVGLWLGLSGGSKPTEVSSSSASHSTKGKAKVKQDPNKLVFKHVSSASANRLEGSLVRLRGVHGVTYYPKTSELDVFMLKTSTQAQKDAARQAVTKG